MCVFREPSAIYKHLKPYYIMVKRSLFWGQAAGKLGEAVYYRAGGEQRTRTYIKNIKNPKTQAQAIQRARLNNLTACFRGASIFLRSFFKAPKANQSAFNAFVAENSRANNYVANDTMVKIQQGIPLGLLFANGDSGDDLSLSIIQCKSVAEPEVGGKYALAKAMYLPELQSNDSTLETSSGMLKVVDGKTLYSIFTAPQNGFTLPAEFDLTVLFSEGAGDGMIFVTATVHCSATSTDTLHIVQKSQNVALTNDDIADWILAGGVSVSGGGEGATTPGMGQLAFGSTAVAANEVACSVGVVLSYTGANGKTWNQVYMPTTEALTTEYGTFTYDGVDGREIVAGYTATQNTI